jgi:hypothetical protein
MTSPSPMTLYSGHVAIGEIRDGGAGAVAATYITATGRREALGMHKDRRAARLAIEARHAGGPGTTPSSINPRRPDAGIKRGPDR